MAQHDYVIANQSGNAFRSDLNNGLSAIVSQNSGSATPSTTYAYMWWADTTTGLLKIRNAANNAFVTVGTLATTNLGLAPLASPTFTGTVTAPTFTASTGVNIPLGSAGSPSLYFTGDLNTGLFSPGADTVALVTGGTNRLHITSTGLVGIGNTGPSYALDVSATGSTISSAFRTDQSENWVALKDSGTTLGHVRLGSTSNAMLFYAGNGIRAWIDSSGRLIVGTTSGSGNNYLQIQGDAGGATGTGGISLRRNVAPSGMGEGSTMGIIDFGPNDGGVGARITGVADAQQGTNDYPGRLVFSTTANGASSPTERFRIGSDGQLGIGGATYGTSGQVLTSGGASAAPTWSAAPSPAALTTASGSAPSYSARAWVNFDGTANTNLTGTYSQSGTTVTVTATAHGLIAGNAVFADITSGTGVDGDYTVAIVTNANTFTYTAGTSLTTSGNITIRRNTIRGSGNVSSIADNGTGDYTVNFTTAMPDANYSAVTGTRRDSGTLANWAVLPTTYSTSSLVVNVMPAGNNQLVDSTFVNVVIFR